MACESEGGNGKMAPGWVLVAARNAPAVNKEERARTVAFGLVEKPVEFRNEDGFG